MRTLDRYLAKQLFPVWLWCISIFIFIVCLVDLFGRLDEIISYHIPASVIYNFYLNFIPIVIVWSSPMALLIGAAFVSMRMSRYQEFLAMKAGGLSLFRSGLPFLFIGWIASLFIFGLNETVVPKCTVKYEQLRSEDFRATLKENELNNVTSIDEANRLYHARLLDRTSNELVDLTVLEHDANKRPKRTVYARRAIYTSYGWLLLYGNVTQINKEGMLSSEPEPFVERIFKWPVTIESFQDPEKKADTLNIRGLRALLRQLKEIGIKDTRSYKVDLAAKMSLPIGSFIMCLIGFIGPTRRYTRGHMQGLGESLLWGVIYYLAIAVSQGFGKQGFLPVFIAVWMPHAIAAGICARVLRYSS